MQKTIYFKPQILPSKGFFLINANAEMEISLHNIISKPPFFPTSFDLSLPNHRSSLSLSRETQTQNSIICARKSKWRFGSPRSRKFVLESMSIIASNLNILPEPLNLVIREFGGGNGGGLGFWKGSGGGGFEGWRRRKRNLGLFGFLIACGLGLLLGLEVESDVFWKLLGLALFGFSIKVGNRGIKDWVLGFFCGVALVCLGVRREEVKKWIADFRVCIPVMRIVRRRRKTRRAMIINFCANSDAGDLNYAKSVFQQIDRPSVYIWNSMIKGYSNSDNPEEALIMYRKMQQTGYSPDCENWVPLHAQVAWTSLIAGYVNDDQASEAIRVFMDMELWHVEPNEITMLNVLVACARSRDIDTGRWVHNRIWQIGYVCKCGSLNTARDLFNKMPQRDLVAWNSMIGAYNQYGGAEEALCLFFHMRIAGL
ncbi:hypothetical protein L1049_020551 [Liquidambar formosana]|uniref:Pentatricopeptide repeat-containing protein n=1 Tax=Liquidambar formosana TaxID=63359 RepID=A0AAP0SCW8_LIQFO